MGNYMTSDDYRECKLKKDLLIKVNRKIEKNENFLAVKRRI